VALNKAALKAALKATFENLAGQSADDAADALADAIDAYVKTGTVSTVVTGITAPSAEIVKGTGSGGIA